MNTNIKKDYAVPGIPRDWFFMGNWLWNNCKLWAITLFLLLFTLAGIKKQEAVFKEFLDYFLSYSIWYAVFVLTVYFVFRWVNKTSKLNETIKIWANIGLNIVAGTTYTLVGLTAVNPLFWIGVFFYSLIRIA